MNQIAIFTFMLMLLVVCSKLIHISLLSICTHFFAVDLQPCFWLKLLFGIKINWWK